MNAALDRRALLRLAGGLTATAALGTTPPAVATGGRTGAGAPP